MYVTFFEGKSGRMSQETFHKLCVESDFDAECVELKANSMGYTYYPLYGMALIDFIGFDFPFDVYDCK